MNNDFEFDQFVKDRFSNSNAEVPAQMWDNILAARRKSEPKGFWASLSNGGKLLIAASILIFSSIGGYLVYQSSSPSINKNGKQKTMASTSLSTQDSKPVIESGKKEKADNDLSSNTDKSLSTQNTSHSNILTASPTENKAGYTTGRSISNTQSKLQQQGKAFYTTSQGQTQSDLNSLNSETTPFPDKVSGDKESTHTQTAEQLFRKTPFTINNARDLSSTSLITQKSVRFPNCPTIEKNAAGNKRYWEIYAGPDYVFNNYKTFGDTASYNYLQKRKSSTQFTSAFSAGARYTRVFENGMSLRAGVNYSQVNEKFSYVNPNELKYITVITRRVVVRSPGDTLYFSDTLQYQQSGTHVKTTYNHYRSVDIPLVMGYELGNGKIHANINAGVIINVYSWYKGDVLDTSYQPVSITTGKGSSTYQFRTNIGVGFLGSASVYYKLTDKMHLVVEPYFRYNLSPMSKDNLNLQQKNHTVGMRMGLRFDLP